MQDLAELYSKKNKYINLKENLTYILKYINASNDSLLQSKDNLKANYLVDDISISSDKVSSVKEYLSDTSVYLRDVVIPSINDTILKIKKQIEEKEGNLLG